MFRSVVRRVFPPFPSGRARRLLPSAVAFRASLCVPAVWMACAVAADAPAPAIAPAAGAPAAAPVVGVSAAAPAVGASAGPAAAPVADASAGPAAAPAADASAGPVTASAPSVYRARYPRRPSPAELSALGARLFAEPALSVSGRQACTHCHDPGHAWAPANDRAVQSGGPGLDAPGVRAVPSLRYRQFTPSFEAHYRENDGDDSDDLGPTGGFGWDGRFASAHQQASGPLLSAFEMGGPDWASVVRRLKASASAPAMRDAFGATVFDDAAVAWSGLLYALEVFQQDAAAFAPFSSRFDAWARGSGTLTAAERHGLELFDDPARANCASCHPSARRHGAMPLFTDHGLLALGVPRNRALSRNADPGWFDLGLCGPLRTDLSGQRELCGRFRTPSLRNVAGRCVFMHNGVFRSLDEVVAFYADRPAVLAAAGSAGRFDDLPPDAQDNVEREAPFDEGPDAGRRLSPAERADLVAFLRTLNDADVPECASAMPAAVAAPEATPDRDRAGRVDGAPR